MRAGAGCPTFWHRRISRRQALRSVGGVAAAGLLAGSLIGCEAPPSGQQAVSGTTGLVPGPDRPGVLSLAMPSQMTDLHPHLSGTSRAAANLYVYDHLINCDYVNGKYELAVAASLEMPDPLTYVFKLKPSARFQNLAPVDGRTVASADVVASWKAFTDNPRTIHKELFVDYVDRFDTPDPATLVVKMKEPNAWALGIYGLGARAGAVIVPKELLDTGQLDKVAIGPGPYVLEKFDRASELTFAKRPDGWYVPNLPNLDKVAFHVITNPSERAAALKAKQIDMLGARDKLQAAEFQKYGADMRIDRQLTYPPMLLMRADAQGPFKDPRVRQAVYAAIDVQEIIERVEFGEGETSGPVPPQLTAWALPVDEVKKYFPHDLQKARDLLSAAGWDASRQVEIRYPTPGQSSLLAETLQKQLAAVGIKSKLLPSDLTIAWSQTTLQERNFQMAAALQLLQYQDPNIWLRYHTSQGLGNGNIARWSDPEVDAVVRRQMTEFDAEKQRSLILDAQRLLLGKFSPIVNLYAPYSLTARWSYVRGNRTGGSDDWMNLFGQGG